MVSFVPDVPPERLEQQFPCPNRCVYCYILVQKGLAYSMVE
ncbi:MAG: hypothetical protein RIM23_20320 [Coleofasciculus sp. G3-WIS-01]